MDRDNRNRRSKEDKARRAKLSIILTGVAVLVVIALIVGLNVIARMTAPPSTILQPASDNEVGFDASAGLAFPTDSATASAPGATGTDASSAPAGSSQ